MSTLELNSFFTIDNQNKILSDLILLKETSKNKSDTQGKINNLIKLIVKNLNENETSLIHETFKFYHVHGNSTENPPTTTLTKTLEMLAKCGYKESPFKKIKKKVDHISKEGQELATGYRKLNTDLTDLLDNIRISDCNDKILKETDDWLRNDPKWFYTNPMENYIGEDNVRLAQEKLAAIQFTVNDIRKRKKAPRTKASKNLLGRMGCILPKNFLGLPKMLKFEVFRFLPASDHDEISASYNFIYQEIVNPTNDYQQQLKVLAKWINQQQIPLSELNLDKDLKNNLLQLAPYLTFMDLRNLGERRTPPWTDKEITLLIERASSSLVTLKTSRGDTLPKNLPKLKHLDIMGSRFTKISQYLLLETLDCSSSNITDIPELPNLKTLNCSLSRIRVLPELANLESLNCMLCQYLIFVPFYPKLIDSNYKLSSVKFTNNRNIDSSQNLLGPHYKRKELT